MEDQSLILCKVHVRILFNILVLCTLIDNISLDITPKRKKIFNEEKDSAKTEEKRLRVRSRSRKRSQSKKKSRPISPLDLYKGKHPSGTESWRIKKKLRFERKNKKDS
ncbi:MAG: hypothetical protein MJ252_17700 [archaeon]|nr:hypothetical protein [archaeon]